MERGLMKSYLLIAIVMMFAGLANAKNRYMITFKSAQGFSAMSDYLNLENSNVGFKVQRSLKNLNVIIVKANSAEVLAGLKNHPEVASIEAEVFYPSPKPIYGFKPARMIQTQAVKPQSWNAVVAPQGGETPILSAGPKTPWGILAVQAGAAWAESSAGANARVLVLDTGIDEGHQDIKANFEKGKNFSEDDSGVIDPLDYKDHEGHGTHTSGTIAASYNEATGFTGVAPKAKLLMGRVCAKIGCSNIAVSEGIDWGIQEKVDVISMSLGGPFGSPAEQQAVQNAENAGVVIVAASGNGGNNAVSFPAAFPTVVAVGAIDSTLKKTSFSQYGPELAVVAPGAAVVSTVPRGSGRESHVNLSIAGVKHAALSSAFSGTKLVPTPIENTLVFAGLGKPEDFAKINVQGKFALVSRGEIKFADKIKNAMDSKAVGIVIFNNAPGLMQGAVTQDGTEIDFPVVMIEQTEGQALVTALTNGSVASAEISTVAADYAMFDGTSMATPHVAGVVALIRSANKKLTPAQVKALLKSTATPLGPNTANEYGAGLVQADKAVHAAVGM